MRVTGALASLCASLSLCLPRTASAQAPGTIELGTYGQITVVDPSQARFESRTPLSLGVRGRVNLHRGIGVELEASTGTVDGVGDHCGGATTSSWREGRGRSRSATTPD